METNRDSLPTMTKGGKIEKKDRRLIALVTESQFLSLESFAKENQRSIATVVREAIEEFLTNRSQNHA